MKTLKTLFSISFIMFSIVQSFAQLKVNSNGEIRIGNFLGINNDYNDAITIEVFGRNTTAYRPGAKLSFGDFGSSQNYSANAWIGEYSNTDTDALELGGKNGIFFKAGGTLDYEVARLENDGDFFIRGTLYQNYPYLVSSDKRLKTNFRAIENPLTTLKKLNGLQYDYIMTEDKTLLTSLVSNANMDAKGLKDLEKFKNDIAKKIENGKNQYGFSAQDVKLVYPDLVKEDDKGLLALNYTGMIPILVEALKEQQKIIDEQNKKIEILQNDITAIKKKIGMQ
jgi:hypothetical protein